MPFLALSTPAFENSMVGDFYGRRGRHIDHLSHSRQTDPSQSQLAIGTGHDPMLHDLRRRATGTTMVVFGSTFLPLLLFFRFWLFHVRFDKLRRRRLLLFQFLDADQSLAQIFPHLAQLSQGLVEGFSQRLVFRSKVSDFFLLCHGLSLSERSSVNSIAEGGLGRGKGADSFGQDVFRRFISGCFLTFMKNICTIISGEAQLGRSRLKTILENPSRLWSSALELGDWQAHLL